MLKNLSLESRNTQTQKWAPIQSTVWPRNETPSENFLGSSVKNGHPKIVQWRTLWYNPP